MLVLMIILVLIRSKIYIYIYPLYFICVNVLLAKESPLMWFDPMQI